MRVVSSCIKPLIYLLVVAMIFPYSSCKKSKDDKDCINNVLGTYSGTQTCPSLNTNLNLIISTSSQPGEVVITVGGTVSTFNGQVQNCSTINIPSQTVAGQTGTINGTLNVNGKNITGILNRSNGVSCSYNLTKL
jgi:hypothetical protein